MSQFISLQEGIAMTTDYRLERAELINSSVIAPALLPLCETFDKRQVTRLLNKPDAQALRVYLGLQTGQVKLILVAVDEQGCDMLPPATTATTLSEEDDDYLLERGERCPSNCPSVSPLND